MLNLLPVLRCNQNLFSALRFVATTMQANAYIGCVKTALQLLSPVASVDGIAAFVKSYEATIYVTRPVIMLSIENSAKLLLLLSRRD